MEFLIRLFLPLILFPHIVKANPDNSLYKPSRKPEIRIEEGPNKKIKKTITYLKKEDKYFKLCDSAAEFQEAYEFINKQAQFNFTDIQVVEKALAVSKGCNGAADRFESVYNLLSKSGVDLFRSFETATLFAQESDITTATFKQIFQKAFLENHLNFDFSSAFKLSLELSRNYKGDSNLLEKDFVQFVKFCTTEVDATLSLKTCGEIVVEMSKYTAYYKNGVYASFEEIYKYLRKNKWFGLSIKDTLLLMPKILSQGETAPKNFKNLMEYILGRTQLKISDVQALQIAIQVANQSLKEEKTTDDFENIREIELTQ